MPNYPTEIYLQNNLRLTEKRTVRDDARLTGLDRHAGPTATPNYSIPLKAWIQEQIDNEELIIPCTCDESECSLTAYADVFKFVNNGLAYQFLDIVHNDRVNDNITDLNIIIVDDSNLSGNRAVEVVTSPYYPYPIVKLTKPVSEGGVGNIDEPEEFTYKLTGTCNGEEIESNTVEVVILPVSVNIEEYINENLI